MKRKEEIITKVRNIIYDYVYDKYGELEADYPSWYIPTLAEYIVDNVLDKNYIPEHTYYNSNDEEVSY